MKPRATLLRYSSVSWLSFLLALFSVPSPAYADMGTPLIWVGLPHLLVGNALIGLIEGWLISWLFKVKPGRAIWTMVLANYVSFIVGSLLVSTFHQAGPLAKYQHYVYPMGFEGLTSLESLKSTAGSSGDFKVKISWFLALASYVGSVVVEWPFCFWVLREKANRLKSSFYASVIAQSTSYAFIVVPWYLLGIWAFLSWHPQ